MTTIKQIALTLFLICLFALFMSAQAQTPSIEVMTDSHQARFAAQGDAHEMRVEVYAPSGEMVFDSGTVTGQIVEWRMQNQKGEPVSDGLYLATFSTKSSTGQRRKRIEQIVVSREPQTSHQPLAPSAPEAAITGTGTGTATSGTIARFTGASTIGNSVIVQSATKNIGIGTTTPLTAKLQVNGVQPANSANNGAAATTLLQTTGGKGGNTTVGGGKVAGAGASISLVAGNGGDAPAGSTRGKGGSITLQPGSTGAGAGLAGGLPGNILLAPSGVGSVIIGTTVDPSGYKLKVVGGSSNGVYADTNGIAVYGQSERGFGVYGNSSYGFAGHFIGKVYVSGDLEAASTASFGATARQMINLFNTDYGIGVQAATQYFRSDFNFAWFKGGLHSNAAGNPGPGGTVLMALDSAGNLSTRGAVNPTSDRSVKRNFAAVNSRQVLERVARLPVQTWSYKADKENVRHMGPVAQDFRSAFDLGVDDKTIATVDADGVALASIQALYQQNQELAQEVRTLRTELRQLKRSVKQQRKVRR